MGNPAYPPPMPGPWGFLTSGYFVGLVIMAFILNRIQNIVVPPRRPHAFRHHDSQRRRRPVSIGRALLGLIFPLDFSSARTRLLLRVPSLYFLAKAVAIWITLLAQSQDSSLFTRLAILQPIGEWVAQKSIEDVCWYTFMSTCLTLCIGTLTTGLEGLNINESAPFNLFAFAFQLYVESASHPAHEKESALPERPNPHHIITILLPLLQLVVLHCLEIQHRWSRYRLAFSTAGGLFAVLHFHYVVWFSPIPYPLTTYAARVVETIMLSVISITVVLNVLTQLLSEGAVTRPLFAHSALMPRPEEDFNVALFRIGTASMEATAVAGLGNEVGGVTSARQMDMLLAYKREIVHGELDIDRSGVSDISPAYEQRGKKRIVKKGFANEISNVKVKAASTDFWMNTVLNVAWQKHLVTFVVSAWHATKRLWSAAMAKARGRGMERARPPSVVLLHGPAFGAKSEESEDVDPYERFLRGESVSDDEDDFEPEDERTPESDTSDQEEAGTDTDEGADAEWREEVQLYADLASDVTSAPVLLAHIAGSPSSPLTRRGYRRLVSGPRRTPSDADEWDDFVLERRQATRSAGRDEELLSENARTCVICTVEPRDIICWPCRCLALCDDCRNNLASRSSASKHACPCCRRSVEGYSKIYIP
ncbi:hypothetical protein K466DRAFT_479001 [Polyporus arcularius HHB13444]|uniref:RING-type domain-containing protein n=1 Tax=Polyporus arcularius HHB13444 TaxID=1314778 RepID=A0A5C3PWW5_9APHY|nr:hypothetical protein K466DRAFT_479001 [Polyporus arcularius HHB13444]